MRPPSAVRPPSAARVGAHSPAAQAGGALAASDVVEQEGASLDASSPPRIGRPLSASVARDSLIVFDWDDTILPTSWLDRMGSLSAGGPSRPDIERQLTQLSAVAIQTLNMAATMGKVILITNSAPGWVDQSCQLFMPQLMSHVRSLPTFSKPMQAPLTFKIGSFRTQVRGYGCRNIVSIGDGDSERAACLRLQAPAAGRGAGGDGDPQLTLKSVKLVDLPSCSQLISEHEMLQTRLADVVAYKASDVLDLKAKFSVGSANFPPMEEKVGCCQLVHFNRPSREAVLQDSPVGRQCSDDAVTPQVKPSPSGARSPSSLYEEAGSPKVQNLRSLPTPLRGLPGGLSPAAYGGAQLPPLGKSASAVEMDFGTPSRNTRSAPCNDEKGGAGGLFERSASVPGGGLVGSNASGNVEAEERDTTASPSRGSPTSPSWKVQGVGDTRGLRSPYHGIGKKKSVLADSPFGKSPKGGVAMRACTASAVWREHSAPAAARGF